MLSSTRGELFFPSEVGTTYLIERSLNLRSGTWEQQATIPGNGGDVQWPFEFASPGGFYRLGETP